MNRNRELANKLRELAKLVEEEPMPISHAGVKFDRLFEGRSAGWAAYYDFLVRLPSE